jgi:molybdopterin converting factor small subunit
MMVRDLGISRELSVEAATFGELVARIDTDVSGFKDSICDELEQIRTHVNVFVNGVNVRGRLDALAMPLRDGDRVHILPSVAGGAHGRRVAS